MKRTTEIRCQKSLLIVALALGAGACQPGGGSQSGGGEPPPPSVDPPAPLLACEVPKETVLTLIYPKGNAAGNPGQGVEHSNEEHSQAGEAHGPAKENDKSSKAKAQPSSNSTSNSGQGNGSVEKAMRSGTQHLYFDVRDLSWLMKNTDAVQSLVLDVQVAGAHDGSPTDIQLILNGLLGGAASSDPYVSSPGYDRASDSSKIQYHLHKMKLNGSDPFLTAMGKIFKNQGKLRISLQGRDIRILSATMTVKWIDSSGCSGGGGTDPDPDPPSAPNTDITSFEPSVSPTQSGTMSFAFSSDQIGVSFECSLDGSALELCGTPFSYSGLANGAHAFEVRAVNSFGMADATPARHEWVVDSVPPEVAIENASSLPSITSSNAISVSFGAIDGVRYECSIDGAAYAACASPVMLVGLADGSHSIAIHAFDAADNRSESPAVKEWIVDTVAPIASFVEVAPAATISNVVSKSFVFGANESATFECAIDQGAFVLCQSPVALDGLAEGEHRFEVRATDVAGNLGPAVGYAWRLDFTAPVLSLGQLSPAPGLNNAEHVTVEFFASEEVEFSCSFDDSAPAACASPFSRAIAAEGDHSLVVSARDLAGNAAAALELSWEMDFTLPLIAWGAFTPSGASRINSRALSMAVTPSEPVTYAWLLNASPMDTTQSPLDLIDLEEGAYRVDVNARDLATNPSNALLHEFVVDLTPPVATVEAEISNTGTLQTVNRFTFGANEESSFQCQVDSAGFAACESPLLLSGFAVGEHRFEVRPIDVAGNVGAPVSIVWNVVPPVTTSISSVTPAAANTSSTSLSVSFSASVPNATFLCSWDGEAAAPCSSPASRSGLANGSHNFRVWALDAWGNQDAIGASYSWVVDTNAPVPSSIAASATSTSITVTWQTNEPATSSLTWGSGTNLNRVVPEDGVYKTSHSIRITGLLPNTVYSYRVGGRDRAGNAYSGPTLQRRTNP